MNPPQGTGPAGWPTGDPQQGSSAVKITMDERLSGKKGMRVSFNKTTTSVRDKLRALDTNKDGSLDEDELIKGIEELIHERQMRKAFMLMAIGLFIVVIVLIGAIGGMTYGIIEATKDTKMSGSIMVSNDNTNKVVQVANYDMAVVNGVLVSRTAAGANTTTNGTNGNTTSTSSAVLRSASFTTKQAFSSRVDIRALMEMKYFYVRNAKAELALVVQGVGRVEQAGSVYGTVVKILTTAGTIILDDVMISFEEDMAPIFKQGGFIIDSAGRRLLGVYDIFGFFEYIEDMTVFNLPKNEPKPALPSGDFQMKLKLWEPCIFTYEGNTDNRCITPTSHPVVANLTGKTPTGRHLSQSAGSDSTKTAGVETMEDGLEYMTSINTVTRVGTLVQTIYEYVAWPTMYKIEVMDEAKKNVSSWQVSKPVAGLPTDSSPYWCSSYSLPSNFFDSAGLARNTSAVTFEFIGYATKMGVAARQFKLTAPNAPNADGSSAGTITVNYFDNADTKYPLYFDFVHPSLGRMMMHVESFKKLDDSTRPSVASLQPPLSSTCTTPSTIGRMSSPFVAPPTSLPGMGAGPASGRRMLSVNGQSFTIADGPAGAHADVFDMGSGIPATNSSNSRRHLLGTCDSKTTIYSNTLGPCSFGVYSVQPPDGLQMSLGCNGYLTPSSAISLTGSADINTCTGNVANGCIKMVLDLNRIPTDQWYGSVVKVVRDTIGTKQLDMMSMCSSYNWGERTGYLRGSYNGPPLNLWIAKAEVSAEMRFSACCVWVSYVSLEAWVGIDLWFWRSYSSVGKWNYVQNYYLTGTPAQQVATANPTIINAANEITIGEGYWGDWSGNSYCYTQTEAGKGKGTSINGIKLKIQPQQANGGDNTALNGIQLQCSDATVLSPTAGAWGDWSTLKTCPTDTYVVGAQIRMDANLGNAGDDTAANSLRVKCSDGTVLAPNDGIWGDWGSMVECPTGQFVCGIKTRVQAFQANDDDSALNGVKLFCCNSS